MLQSCYEQLYLIDSFIMCKCAKHPFTKVYQAVCRLKAVDVTHAAQHNTNQSISQSIKEFLYSISEAIMASTYSEVTRRRENALRIYGGDAVSNSEMWAKQTCKSALTVIERDTDNSVLLCCKHRRNIFYINFLCLHLFECKYDTARAALLFLVRWSLATNESFMRGFIFKERIKS